MPRSNEAGTTPVLDFTALYDWIESLSNYDLECLSANSELVGMRLPEGVTLEQVTARADELVAMMPGPVPRTLEELRLSRRQRHNR